MKRMNTHFTLFTHTNYDDFNKKIDEKRGRGRSRPKPGPVLTKTQTGTFDCLPVRKREKLLLPMTAWQNKPLLAAVLGFFPAYVAE